MELISFLNYRKKSNVSKAKAGEKEAFVSLIDENRLNIYRVAKGILREEKDIEDAIQNTVIKAFEKINTLKINECNDILRKNKRLVSFEEAVVEEKYSDKYENIDLTNAITSLNEDLRSITVLYYFEDMSTVEIAKFLEIPEGTVRSRLSRAREKLREVLKEV